MCQTKEKLLTKCHVYRSTADKVLRVNNVYNRKRRLLTVCLESNTKTERIEQGMKRRRSTVMK